MNIRDILNKIPVTPHAPQGLSQPGQPQISGTWAPSWGFTHPSFSNGAAYGDLDDDGDLDLVINNENGPAFLYRNNSRPDSTTTTILASSSKAPAPIPSPSAARSASIATARSSTARSSPAADSNPPWTTNRSLGWASSQPSIPWSSPGPTGLPPPFPIPPSIPP